MRPRGPNLQNFVRWAYENVTKESGIRKAYEKNAIFEKKILRKTYDSLLADLEKHQTRMHKFVRKT